MHFLPEGFETAYGDGPKHRESRVNEGHAIAPTPPHSFVRACELSSFFRSGCRFAHQCCCSAQPIGPHSSPCHVIMSSCSPQHRTSIEHNRGHFPDSLRLATKD